MKTVVVVGAGAAGLAAASKLMLKFDVTVLEASDRIGGRIRNLKGDKHMGAQFIHGEIGNVAFQMAKELDLIDVEEEEEAEFVYVKETGEVFNSSNAMSEMVTAVEEAMEAHEVSDPAESLGQYYMTTTDRLAADKSESFKEDMRMFLDSTHRGTQLCGGCDSWYQDSFLGHAKQYKECDGNLSTTFKTDKSFISLMEHLAKDIPKDKLRLNSEVTRIESVGDMVEVTVKGKDVLKANYVVFTGSLGFLKAHARSLFHPALSEAKLNIIEKQGFGTVNKIYLKFERPWWEDKNFVLLFSDHSVDYANDSSLKWTRWVYGLMRLRHQDNVLVAWLAGMGARMMEELSDETILENMTELMERFLRKSYPGMTKATEITVTRWHGDRWANGSYSFMSVDTAVGPGEALSLLAEPTGERVLFAGEHTHSHYFATVHGAMETGWREADRILERESFAS